MAAQTSMTPTTVEDQADLSKMSPDDLRQVMATTRQTISERLMELESEVERRVLDTVDQVSQRVTETTGHISQRIRAPIDKIQGRVNEVPKEIESRPMRSLAMSAGAGFVFGALLGRRAIRKMRKRMQYYSPSPQVIQQPVVRESGGQQTALKAAIAGIAVQVTQQLVHMGIERYNERRRHYAHPPKALSDQLHH